MTRIVIPTEPAATGKWRDLRFGTQFRGVIDKKIS
jgi:hypothetical protein